jgi:acyl-CoA thioester hydrolase
VRWDDIDANGHAGNTAYSVYATDARLTHFAEHGFSVARLGELRVGPVLFTEELAYRRELRLGDTITTTVELAALSPTGHRWAMHHRILRGAELAASVHVTGAWIDLDRRKLIGPPGELLAVFAALPRFEPQDGGGPSA